MIVRRDHVGGGVFVVVAALVLAVSGDLPFGTLASPGAGMLPKLVIGLMMAFGLDPAGAGACAARLLPPSRGTIFPTRCASPLFTAAGHRALHLRWVHPDRVAAAVRPDLPGRAQARC